MKVKKQLFLDALIGIPSVFLLNIVAKTLGFIFGIDHSFKKPPSIIFVCKFLGMGSLIQATPLLQTLRKNFPEAKIVFISSSRNKSILQMMPFIDDTIFINDSSISGLFSTTISAVSKCWKLRSKIHPSLYIDLEVYSYYSTILATLSCATDRLGYFRKDSNIRMGVYTHMVFFNSKAPISAVYLQMARLIGVKETNGSLYKFSTSIETDNSLTQKLNIIPAYNTRFRNIIINPNASDLRLERRWPKENFSSLIESLVSSFPDHNYVLIGSTDESEYVGSLLSLLPSEIAKRVTDTSGKLSVAELISLIGNAEWMITNDTGPLHIAYSMGVKTLALFGPCSPEQYGSSGNTINLYKNVYCSPCVHQFQVPPCHGDNQCMKQISVGETFAKLENALKGNVEYSHPHREIAYTKADSEVPLGVIDRN